MSQAVNRTPLNILMSILCEPCKVNLFRRMRDKAKKIEACETCQADLDEWAKMKSEAITQQKVCSPPALDLKTDLTPKPGAPNG